MAEKRMLSKVISSSEKVNDLPDFFCMLLYTWMIPHADDFGRLVGSPRKIKAVVVPMMEHVTSDQVDKALFELDKSRLIQWYEVDGSKYIQIVDFDEHQSGLHKRTKSKFPEPPLHTINVPGNSGKVQNIPLELNRTEQNRTEENRTEQNGTEGSGESAILKFINESGLKCRGAFELDQVTAYLGVMDVELIIEALKRSEQAGKVVYALAILKEWNGKGWRKLSDAKEAPKPKPYSGGGQGRSGKPHMQMVGDGPEERPPTEEELEEMRRKARRLDDERSP